MKAVADGRPWDRHMPKDGKEERERAQYALSAVKDPTSAKIQNFLSSSNMAKPIKSSLRKTGVATWCVKVVEDALSLFLV